MITTLDLRDISDAERDERLNVAVAEIAGWQIPDHCRTKRRLAGEGVAKTKGAPSDFGRSPTGEYTDLPRYATSADAVLPLLEKHGSVVCLWDSFSWTVEINEERGSVEDETYDVVTIAGHDAKSLAECMCIVLLKAHGVEILT